MMLATFESLLGSIWFACVIGFGGYLMGHILPINKLVALFGRK